MDNNNLYRDNNQSDENTNRVTNESASGTVGAASSEPMKQSCREHAESVGTRNRFDAGIDQYRNAAGTT